MAFEQAQDRLAAEELQMGRSGKCGTRATLSGASPDQILHRIDDHVELQRNEDAPEVQSFPRKLLSLEPPIAVGNRHQQLASGAQFQANGPQQLRERLIRDVLQYL